MPHGKGQKGPAASRAGAEVAGPLHAGSWWRADGPPRGVLAPWSSSTQARTEESGCPCPSATTFPRPVITVTTVTTVNYHLTACADI